MEKLTIICENDWDLPTQIYELEKWLKKTISNLPPSSYFADIGFNIRKDATGGGTVIELQFMKTLVSIGMELYLSEYPGIVENDSIKRP